MSPRKHTRRDISFSFLGFSLRFQTAVFSDSLHYFSERFGATEAQLKRTLTIHAIIDAAVMRRQLVSGWPPLPLSNGAAELHLVRAQTVLMPVGLGAPALDHTALFMMIPST